VLVTIITDGEENSSKEFTGQMIKKMIDELKALGWVFTFIGANIDVEKVAAQISINNSTSPLTKPMKAPRRCLPKRPTPA